MKRWKLAVLVCAVVTCACLLLAGCGSQNYKPAAKEQTVPASALGAAGTLRVGVDASHAPLAGKPKNDPNGKTMGIDVDVAECLADEMGLKLEIVDIEGDAQEALDSGKVDVVLGVDASDTDGTYWKSEPYMVTGVALFGTSAENSVPTLNSKPKIAAKAPTTVSWRVTNLFGDGSLISKESTTEAFEALISGSSRYVAADAVVGTYNAKTGKYDAKIVALLGDASGYCAAVASNNTELQSAVATAIGKLVSGGIIDVIEAEYLGSPLNLSQVAIVKSQLSDSNSSAGSAAASGASAASASSAAAASDAAASTEAASAGSATQQ